MVKTVGCMTNPRSLDEVPFPALARALFNWQCQACALVRNMNGFRSVCDSFYVKIGQDRFEERCRERNVYEINCAALTLQLPSMQAVANAMGSDEQLRPLYGKWVGVGGNLLGISAQVFADKCRVADYDYNTPAQLY